MPRSHIRIRLYFPTGASLDWWPTAAAQLALDAGLLRLPHEYRLAIRAEQHGRDHMRPLKKLDERTGLWGVAGGWRPTENKEIPQ